MLDNKIGNISIRYCFIMYKFCNFVILSGLLLFVFGVDTEIAFRRLCMTHFTFIFSSNRCANYPKYT